MGLGGLLSLSRDDLNTLIQAQAEQIAALSARIGELEAKLAVTPKTPGNSSLPPSKGQKPNFQIAPTRNPVPAVPARRAGSLNIPTRSSRLWPLPARNHALSPANLGDIHAYDHVDLPPIQPITTRIHRHRGVCPCCH
jgi:transposase